MNPIVWQAYECDYAVLVRLNFATVDSILIDTEKLLVDRMKDFWHVKLCYFQIRPEHEYLSMLILTIL